MLSVSQDESAPVTARDRRTKVASCRHKVRLPVLKVFRPRGIQQTHTRSDHFAQFFRGKVDGIRASTAAADPPVITIRQVPPLSDFEPATVTEISNLLKYTPAVYVDDGRTVVLQLSGTKFRHSDHAGVIQELTRGEGCESQGGARPKEPRAEK